MHIFEIFIISDVSEEDSHGENSENDEGEIEGEMEGASGGGTTSCGTGETEVTTGQGDMYDHLHQLFITKVKC